ncbi:hypothetical protein DOTSEDRAFT_22810 [Dothistroma septosporum NZE10]|uniref:SprT-like domain-containing protein n=1 Tax=Dothistroma septosporum (strain NZE10 / CBS 128990) TaxID=675120 RepID=N1PWK6_DOTSN|nr:hypothetical protein DOTSEDRAFT_22810 [Dothistroma septosporum NZE10]
MANVAKVYSHKNNRPSILAKHAIEKLEARPQSLGNVAVASDQVARLLRWTKELERLMPIDMDTAAATLPTGLRLLSSPFFCGHVSRSVAKMIFDLSIVERGAWGETVPAINDQGNRCCTINLATHDRAGRMRSIEELLGTILHELGHAYMYLFGCRCEVCHWNIMRLNGHFKGWRMLARSVEKKAREVLGMRVNLENKESAEFWWRKEQQFLKK